MAACTIQLKILEGRVKGLRDGNSQLVSFIAWLLH
jgi:hypothetical protein